MDYQDDFDIPDEYPDIQEVVALSSKKSNPISSPINSAHRYFDAFPSDFKKKQKITHFKENRQKNYEAQKHRTSEDHKGRSLKEFLNFQKSFEEQRQRKLSKLKEQRERQQAQECRNIPFINNHSRKLTSHVESTCYERLSKEKTLQQTMTQPQFHPQILNKSKSMYRKQNVADLLYDDAQRRIEKQKITQKQVLVVKPKINANTDRLVIKSIKSQFEHLIKNTRQITQQVALNILGKLFHVDFTAEQQEIVHKRQKILNCLFKNKSITNKIIIWSFIQLAVGTKQTGSIFNEKEQKLIYKQFKHFLYRNRMMKERQKTYEDEPTFRPQILKNSERLARRKREKMVLNAEGLLEKQNVKLNVSDSYKIPIADLYILERIHNQQENRVKKQNGEAKDFQKCTFKPQLNKWNGMRSAAIIPLDTKSSRARQSFNKKQQQNYDNTLLFTTNTLDSIQFDREERKRSGSQSSMNKSFRQVKNMETTLLRMSAGRKQKQYLNQCQQRGYPKDIDNWEKFRQKEKKELESTLKQLKGYNSVTSPKAKHSNAIIFDVHISKGKIETIHLDRSEDIINKVEQLSQKYSLNEEKKIKLVKMIRSNLSQYLQNKENMI